MTPKMHLAGNCMRLDLSAAPCLRKLEIILPNGQKLIHILIPTPDQAQITHSQLKTLIDQFLRHKEIDQNRKPATLGDYRKRLNQFATWLEQHDHNPADPAAWRAYYTHLKTGPLTPTSVRNHYRNLSPFAAWLVAQGCLPHNPLEGITPPAIPKNTLPRAISPADIRAMLSQTTTLRDKAVLLFFWDTGVRAAEAAALTWADIDIDAGSARIRSGKGHKARTVIFTAAITGQALNAYRQTLPASAPGDPIWQGKRGPLTYSGLYQIFKRLARRAGLADTPTHPHSWRHAFGRDATINGMPTGLLQKLMGHESIETTMIYLGFDHTALAAAHAKHTPLKTLDSNPPSV